MIVTSLKHPCPNCGTEISYFFPADEKWHNIEQENICPKCFKTVKFVGRARANKLPPHG